MTWLLPRTTPPKEKKEGGGDAVTERHAEAERLMAELFAQYDRAESPDWERLRGVQGLRIEPMSWEEAETLIEDGSAMALSYLGRMPLEKRRYRKFMELNVKAKYATVTDYLYASIFNFACESNPDRKLIAVVTEDFGAEERIEWRLNDFPYAFEDGVEHHVLWSSVELEIPRLEELIALNRDPEGKQWQWMYWINPPLLKSVPGIWHAHILSRPIS